MEDLLDAPSRPFRRPPGIENPDLDSAVAAYNDAIEEAVEDVAKPIKKQLEAVSKQGNLELTKRYAEAQRAIERGRCIPHLPDLSKGARTSYEKALRRATQQCSAVYDKALREYTRNKDTTIADRVKQEHAEFLAHPSHRPLHVPTEAIGFRGHWYLISQNSLGLEPAIAAAQKQEGYLLVINDSEENAFIQPLVQDRMRLGLLRVGGTWMTLAPEKRPATFFFWDAGQPENLPRESSVCIHAEGKWHDYPAATSTPYCIEWE